MSFENYNLREWPFRTSADEKYASVWAGRKATKVQLDRLLRIMTIVPSSALHVFWANFGMGKTHSLYHIKHLCSKTSGQIIPIYAVMPKRSTGFLELYRAIVEPFLTVEMSDYLGRQLVDLGQNNRGSNVALHPMFANSPGVVRAILALRSGNLEAIETAKQWISGTPGISPRALTAIGISYRIKTPEAAISALSTLINLVTWGGAKQKQILLMLDEFQRIGELNTQVGSQVNSSLHTIFNAHPTGLQLFLTFSFGRKENVDFLLSSELKSRAQPLTINLDVLSQEESVMFLADLLGEFRITKDEQRPLYPFSKEAVNTMMKKIAQRKTLTPRRIMLYADHIMKEHYLNVDESLEEISENEVQSMLEALEQGELDIDTDN